MSRKSEDAMGILICGLNGTGKSALGRILADRLGYEFIDNAPQTKTGTLHEWLFLFVLDIWRVAPAKGNAD